MMLKISTAKEMQDIDRTTIMRYGVPGVVLMERAGLAVVMRINEVLGLEGHKDKSEIAVLCGGGNNGGDGFVIARVLHNADCKVRVYMTAKPGQLKGDALLNYNAARKFGVPIRPARDFLKHTHNHALIVDALLGTGLSKEVRSPISETIEKVNGMSVPVVAVDIPSGISSDTGEIMGSAIRASHTVTFGLRKRGHVLFPGAEYAGKLFVEEIGFPSGLLVSEKIKVNLVCMNDAEALMPARPEDSHKGTYGHVLLVAGSKGKTGAALMAARSCLKSGAGLVTVGVPESLTQTIQSRVTEEMVLPLPDKGDGTLSLEAGVQILEFMKDRADVLAIGPGLSCDSEISKLMELLITESRFPVVIDADGLNALAGKTAMLRKCRSPIVLTPHPGEMSRLERNEAGGDRITRALSFARKTGTVLVLKGAPTVTAFPDGTVYVNSSGNPGMATAGTGDVLTGIISSCIAQKVDPGLAAILGVYLHGMAGDRAASTKGPHSLVASDLIRVLPAVFRALTQS